MMLCDLAGHFMDRYQITVLATALDVNNIQKYLQESLFFGHKFRLLAPNRNQRSEVYI